MVNAVRQDLQLYIEKASTLSAFFDFVERFGVSSNRLLDQKLSIDVVINEAKETYVDGLYEDALDLAQDAHQALKDPEVKTMKLEDQALIWVYVTEWAAVSGTGMITGYVLYLLMLKRKLCREVEVTRSKVA